jgi:hypothetical protein
MLLPDRPSLLAMLLLVAACANARESAPLALSLDREAWAFGVGTAAISPDLDKGGTGGALELDFFPSTGHAIALRHVGDYEDDGQDSSTNITRICFDWSLAGARRTFEPFAGIGIGCAYGESVNETGLTAAQLGLRYWREDCAFLQAVASYDRFWTRTEDRTEYHRDGAASLQISVGFVF